MCRERREVYPCSTCSLGLIRVPIVVLFDVVCVFHVFVFSLGSRSGVSPWFCIKIYDMCVVRGWMEWTVRESEGEGREAGRTSYSVGCLCVSSNKSK